MALLNHIPQIAILGATEWAKTNLRQAGVYAEACDINVRATSGRRTIAIAKIADAHSFKIIAGGFTKQADSGNPLTRYFCPECGSPLYTVSPVHTEVIYVKAGTFDDSRLIQPRR